MDHWGGSTAASMRWDEMVVGGIAQPMIHSSLRDSLPMDVIPTYRIGATPDTSDGEAAP